MTSNVKNFDTISYIGGICGNAIRYVYLKFKDFNSSFDMEIANGQFGGLIGEFNGFHHNQKYNGWTVEGVTVNTS